MKLNKILFILLMSFAFFIMIPAISFAYNDPYIIDGKNTVSFDENISLNFLAVFPDNDVEGAYVKFKYIHYGSQLEKKVNIKESDKLTYNDMTCYRVRCPLTASEMMIPVTVELYANGSYYPVSWATRSIRQYVDAALNDEENPVSDKERKLMKATLAYGGYTQMNFKYNGENPNEPSDFAYDGYQEAFPKEIIRSHIDYVARPDTYHDVSYVGASVFLRDAPYIRYYFQINNGADLSKYTFTITQNGKTRSVTPVKKGDLYYIQSYSVKAYELDNEQKVNVKYVDDEDSVMNFNYSIIRWVETAVQLSENDNEKNVAKAMYYYYKAAENYVNPNT